MPSGITIIGLGPGDSQYWTRWAGTILQQAAEVYVRIMHHPSVADIPARIYTFDEMNRSAEDTRQIATQVVRLGQRAEGVIYAVPGHPREDATVPLIRHLAATENIPVTIVPGLSLLEAAISALELDAYPKLQVVAAAEVARLHHPPLDPDQPALVPGLSGQPLAAQVKQVLLNAYAPDFSVTLVQGAEPIWSGPLAELDQQPQFDESTILYLPADPANTSLPAFQETIAHLRAPEGCPWDREQTHQSLRPFLLEETYEVLEALDAADPAALAEELGDLLLQIVLHTQIATGAGDFRMGEVIGHINRKLVRRHPHVFGSVTVNGVADVTANWEAIKQEERSTRSSEPEASPSVLDGVPAALPALAQALAISKRAVRVGFEWPNIEGVLDKLIEEAREITETTNPAELESEIGDLLFSAVNLARWRNVDPESALRATNARFTRRFKKLETLAAAQGRVLSQMTIDELDALWDEAKRFEP
ncbi:MAG: nucleoside triphosphate pyrophosphohydrolase [Chloroflexota bacterium]|nr:MAG: nucleoside triphosphate pyrophosphohydrolase [Chloroflexota bacterium]